VTQAADKAKVENDKILLQGECRRKADEVMKERMYLEQSKKEYKALENERNKIKNEIYEKEMNKSKLKKESKDMLQRVEKFIEDVQTIMAEKKLLTERKDGLVKDQAKVDTDLNERKKNILDLNSKLIDLKKTESDAQKTIKNLTTLRGTFG